MRRLEVSGAVRPPVWVVRCQRVEVWPARDSIQLGRSSLYTTGCYPCVNLPSNGSSLGFSCVRFYCILQRPRFSSQITEV